MCGVTLRGLVLPVHADVGMWVHLMIYPAGPSGQAEGAEGDDQGLLLPSEAEQKPPQGRAAVEGLTERISGLCLPHGQPEPVPGP